MKEKKFKIGQRVTYKNKIDFVSCLGTPNSYYHGGIDHGGYIGNIVGYRHYIEEMDCWGVDVTCRNRDFNYHMLEKEFEEYEQPKKRFHMDPVKFV